MLNLMNNDLILNKIILTSGILLVTLLISYFVTKTINFVFRGIRKNLFKTIRSLLGSIINISLFLISLMIILSLWGFNIGPILTGAGILGLTFSFGAQSLVKDVIAGFFIVTENQFNVGDWIKIGNHEGEVHKLTLRLTVLKDINGDFIYIPNSQITSVIRKK